MIGRMDGDYEIGIKSWEELIEIQELNCTPPTLMQVFKRVGAKKYIAAQSMLGF